MSYKVDKNCREIYLILTLVTCCMPTGISIYMTIFTHSKMRLLCKNDFEDYEIKNCEQTCSGNKTYWKSDLKFPENQVTIYKTYNLVNCDDHLRIKASQGFIQIGYLIGSFLSGYSADIFGRKPTLVVCYTIHTILFLVYLILPSIEVFSMVYLTQIAFQVGLSRSVTVLISELFSEIRKPWSNPLYVSGQAIGIVLCSLTAWIFPNWMHQMTAYFVLSVPGFILIYFLPESDTWLDCNQKISKKQVIQEDEPLKNPIQDHDFPLLSIFTNKILLKRFLVFSIFTWPSTLGIYYLLLWSSSNVGRNPYFNSIYMAIADLSACGFTSKFVKYGTRTTFFILHTLTLTLILISWIFEDNESVIAVFFWIERFSSTATFALVTCWVGEVFPTNLRTIGFGVTTSLSRAISFGTPFIASYRNSQDSSLFWLFQIILIGLSLVFSGLFLPESKHIREPCTVADLKDQDNTVLSNKFC